MKTIRMVAGLALVLGLLTAIFAGVPWYIYYDPILPLWLKIAVYAMLGGLLVVLLTVAAERQKGGALGGGFHLLSPSLGCCSRILRKSPVAR